MPNLHDAIFELGSSTSLIGSRKFKSTPSPAERGHHVTHQRMLRAVFAIALSGVGSPRSSVNTLVVHNPARVLVQSNPSVSRSPGHQAALTADSVPAKALRALLNSAGFSICGV